MSEPVRTSDSKPIRAERVWLHVLLFLATLFTTTVAGVAWRGEHDIFDLRNLHLGLEYSSLLLLFLTAHEFGHYIAARIHGVDVTLPFYIPFPGFAWGSINFGTFGAVIRLRSRMPSNRALFDIGVAGPIAGFVVCVATLIYGLVTLPDIHYLQSIHPGYPNVAVPAGANLTFGQPLLFSLMVKGFARAGGYMPPMSEMYHYPALCVGWFGLFVTALNMLPIGQLDGGHVTYALWGKRIHGIIGPLFAAALFLISIPDTLLGLLPELEQYPWLKAIVVPGGSTWLMWSLLTTFVIRFHHPPAIEESELTLGRKILGYMSLAILVLSFTPSPIMLQ